MDDQAFVEKFESGEWPLDEWHHREHIKLAYLYLRRYPFEQALARMRDKIKAHNAVHQVPELPGRGYHETITRAWMQLVDATLLEYGPAQTADGFYDQNP
jgi:hypothetical protein